MSTTNARQLWRKLSEFDLTVKLDLLRACVELLVARLRVNRQKTATLMNMRRESTEMPSCQMVERVSFAIPRVASRLLWRTDCLVQALAARRWLNAYDIPTSLVLGVRKDGEKLSAHAWLMVGRQIVTGGDISSYQPIEDVERRAKEPR